MNKMHSLTKIVLVGIALCIAFHLCTYLISIPMMFFVDASYKWSTLPIVLFILWSLGLAVSIYLLIYKRDKLAEKIVGIADLPDPTPQIQWLPVAFRLVSVAAGLLCLYRVATGIIFALQRYSMLKTTSPQYLPQAFEQILSYLILLAAAIYLLCGAPHFVRWHVKKTIEQYKAMAKYQQPNEVS